MIMIMNWITVAFACKDIFDVVGIHYFSLHHAAYLFLERHFKITSYVRFYSNIGWFYSVQGLMYNTILTTNIPQPKYEKYNVSFYGHYNLKLAILIAYLTCKVETYFGKQ